MLAPPLGSYSVIFRGKLFGAMFPPNNTLRLLLLWLLSLYLLLFIPLYLIVSNKCSSGAPVCGGWSGGVCKVIFMWNLTSVEDEFGFYRYNQELMPWIIYFTNWETVTKSQLIYNFCWVESRILSCWPKNLAYNFILKQFGSAQTIFSLPLVPW